ncbi:MAG: hypothetical protein GX580_13790 [Candidatus Hydrogenedens sp.]|nr:hypothetical protein [Candidatus Hydrogenedentota bacterium]NLF58702.1 hypothetical protein [Candidatus Hydrogenedens sp.]
MVEGILCGAVPKAARSPKLAALLRLLDDPSPLVRGAVAAELAAFGGDLAAELALLPVQPTPEEWRILRELTVPEARTRLLAAWPRTPSPPDDMAFLETGLSLLSRFINGPRRCPDLGGSLDTLAAEHALARPEPDPASLAVFLFRERGLRPVNGVELRPVHADPAAILETGEGIPVALLCIYLLAGARLGFDIRACKWPGHALARFVRGGELVVVDCANGGEMNETEAFLRMQGPSRDAAAAQLAFDVPAATLLGRLIAHLSRLYRKAGEWENCALMLELQRRLDTGK